VSGKTVDPGYVSWLEQESMLVRGGSVATRSAGSPMMSQRPFARANPRAAVERASVWFTAYPHSTVTMPGESFLRALGDEDLWRMFAAIGIEAVHTGPVKRAGGISGRDVTPSVDGHFDRISTRIDDAFGTEAEFQSMCQVAAAYGGTIIDDIVPGHTGKGADFRLAEMKVGDYPGIYHMVEIPPADWHLLPAVPSDEDSVNLDPDTEMRLQQAGYIVGRMQRVLFHEPGVKETNWSATGTVTGVDGVERRWVYLHYFKDGQPSINWLDPTGAGMRLVMGDALHSLQDLGSGALRLDANGFLGLESNDAGGPAWSEGHPLSEAANQLIASMVRKAGGFTFQELNLAIDDIRDTGRRGADLSYDFVNRPAYHHALATGDTEFLRLTLSAALEEDLQPIALVHALQNHDELTYELVHFAATHRNDVFRFRGADVTGAELAITIRAELTERLTGEAAPYNDIFTTNGIASTTATVITAALGISELAELDAEDIEQVKQAHLLLAMFNAWQPGVFAFSGWDLCGMLTLDRSEVAELLATGDTRWINRPAYDLMGHSHAVDPGATMPRGRSLYGSLPEQLEQPGSFVRRLSEILAIRRRHSIATGTQLEVPAVSDPAVLAMVHRLPTGLIQVTALNFSTRSVSGRFASEHLAPGDTVLDMLTGQGLGRVDEGSSLSVALGPHQGTSLLLTADARTARPAAASSAGLPAPTKPRQDWR
jgi:trehalose synthase